MQILIVRITEGGGYFVIFFLKRQMRSISSVVSTV